VSSSCWTAADDAELDVLVHALTSDYFEHRRRCRACRLEPGAPYPCPHLQAAVREVVDWRDARGLLSRAEALRAQRASRGQGKQQPATTKTRGTKWARPY